MKTYKFNTNLKCGGCIAKIKPLLDQIPEIEQWTVDLNTPGHRLTVQLKSGQPSLIIQTLQQAGYQAILLPPLSLFISFFLKKLTFPTCL